MAPEKAPVDIAREIAHRELIDAGFNPTDVFQRVEDGLTRFIENTQDRSFWNDFLDDPANGKIADILTSDRIELDSSILGVFRKALEFNRKQK